MDKVQRLIVIFLVIALVCSVITLVMVNYFPNYQLAGTAQDAGGLGANIKLFVEPPAINVTPGG